MVIILPTNRSIAAILLLLLGWIIVDGFHVSTTTRTTTRCRYDAILPSTQPHQLLFHRTPTWPLLPSKQSTDLSLLQAEPLSTSAEESDGHHSSFSPSTASSKTILDRPVLATLDVIALLVFAAIGKASHAAGDGTSIAQETLAVVWTALPFIVSWLTTSYFTGVYQTLDPKTNNNSSDNTWLACSWKQTFQGWIVAIPLGCVGRGLIKGYVPPLPFVIVTMLATLIILGLMRTAYDFVVVARNQTE
jgi:hypothetical protein